MSRRVTRRRFLKAAAAVSMIPWGWRPGILGSNQKLRIGCIGVGGRGAGNVDGVAHENVVALCDVETRHLEPMAARFKDAKTFFDYREMISTSNLDAVVIATPDHHHAPAALRAMLRGMHVYVEKPLTHTVQEARVLARVAAVKRLVTQMGTQNHRHPVNLEAFEILRSGMLGAVREVHVITDRPGNWWKQGQTRPTETPAIPDTLKWDLFLGPAADRPYHGAYHPFHWRGWWDFGCGAVGDMAIHLMDLAVWALELDAPERVTSKGPPVLAESGPVWMESRFEFPAKGSRPAVDVFWYEGTAKPPEDIAKDLPMNGSLFICDEGRLAVNHTVWLKTLPEERWATRPVPTQPPSIGHHREWLNAIKNGGRASCDFAYAGPFTEAVLLANVAYRTGKTVVWDRDGLTAKGLPEAKRLIAKDYRPGWGVQ